MNRFHWIMTGFLVLMIMCLVIIGSGMSKASTVKPQPKPAQCGTAEQMKAGLKAMGPNVQFSEIGEFGTKLLLAKYNSMPPVSNIIGDHIIIVEVAEEPRILIAVFKDSCFDGYTAMDRNIFRGILRSV